MPTVLTRREQVVITRLRIGHTRLTHVHLLKREPPPQCDMCQSDVTVAHVLLHCAKYNLERQDLDCTRGLKSVLRKDEGSIQNLVKYLHSTNLIAAL